MSLLCDGVHMVSEVPGGVKSGRKGHNASTSRTIQFPLLWILEKFG